MVDYLIVTFIREEFQAVLQQIQKHQDVVDSGIPGRTRVLTVRSKRDQIVTVAIVRTARQGNMTAFDTVLRQIDEHQPRLVLTVGIAGAAPSNDVFLGDVVLATEVHDLTLGAQTAGGREEAASTSYLMNAVKEFVVNVASDDFSERHDWATSIERPTVARIGDSWTDDDEWNGKIDSALKYNENRKVPEIVDGVLACSDELVKSKNFMEQRLLIDRRILANDMESAGVAKACERKNVPLLILRGVSDIVGLPRSDAWKRYACEVVSGCAWELVNLGAVDTIEGNLESGEFGPLHGISDVIGSLDAILHRIKRGTSSEYAAGCREAFELFRKLPDELKRKWAPSLFDTLDRPMKYLGDKQLVLDVATACIECCSGGELDDASAECQARARICGTSWAYQRMNKLGLAEQEAELSKQISEGVRSRENLAYCQKCLGRLKRMRAESELSMTLRQTYFKDSVSSIREAISLFTDLQGPYDAEVGDCYSLLGRTYLSMGNVRKALECVEAAMPRVNVESKDYLDLRILEGDISLANGEYQKALVAFDDVIEMTSEQDYQLSEIVARAHMQRGESLIYMRSTTDAEGAFAEAQRIWEHYKETNFAAEAEWGRIRASGVLDQRTTELLKLETPMVRCGAVRLFEERRAKSSRTVLAQRFVHDDIVWKRLIEEAKHRQALDSDSR